MKTKLFALCLMIFATILLTTPPVFARIYDPLLGIAWRPNHCNDTPGIDTCTGIWNVAWILTGTAVAIAESACGPVHDSQCFRDVFTGAMAEMENPTCDQYDGVGNGEGVPHNEVVDWCHAQWEMQYRGYIPWEDPNCAC